jgi:hypothetical protein
VNRALEGIHLPVDMDNDDIWHVYPTFGREHITNQRDRCWCHPKIEFAYEGAIIIHEVEQ